MFDTLLEVSLFTIKTLSSSITLFRLTYSVNSSKANTSTKLCFILISRDKTHLSSFEFILIVLQYRSGFINCNLKSAYQIIVTVFGNATSIDMRIVPLFITS